MDAESTVDEEIAKEVSTLQQAIQAERVNVKTKISNKKKEEEDAKLKAKQDQEKEFSYTPPSSFDWDSISETIDV